MIDQIADASTQFRCKLGTIPAESMPIVLSSEVQLIQRAARQFHESPEFEQYEQFAGDIYYEWGKP